MHSGVDILLTELRSNTWSLSSVIDMLEDIFISSESSIQILNDLLEYEHMDAGNFRLDLAWKPLLGLFTDRLKWAFFVAKRKNITFTIQDDTRTLKDSNTAMGSVVPFERPAPLHCTALLIAYIPRINCVSCLPVSMSAAASHCKLLLCVDQGKLDQVIRNLLTNAVY